MEENAQRKTRVLFFVWGDSIHARRRIRIFTEDPSFEVGVISTFGYDFEKAENFYLCDSGRVNHVRTGKSFFRKVVRGVLSRLLHFDLDECYSLIADAKLTKGYVKTFRPDIVFLQTLLYPCYLSYLIPRTIPLMITFWNGDVTWWAQWNGVERLFKRKIVEYGVNRASAMTVNSQIAYDACLGYGAPPERIHLIRYPGVDLERFKPASREDARQRLSIRRGKVILCPRGLGGYLNSDIIIEAAATVIARIPEAMFVFISGVGNDAEWQRHLERATQLGIADHLRRDGQVPWDAMPLYYHAADVVVSISSNDSLPNCMLEAMACGTPLVMGDIPQIREWVTDGVNGLLAPPRDSEAVSQAMLRLLEDDGILTSEFVRYNLDLVGREVDSRKNSLLVKQLVHDIAGRHFREGHT